MSHLRDDALISKLQDDKPSERLEALSLCSHCRGSQTLIAAVALCLGDSEFDVREKAVTVLETICEVGNPYAIRTICDCLQDDNFDVRIQALHLLGQIARGDHHAITSVIGRLDDRHRGVKQTALSVLSRIAEKDDQQAIVAISRCMENGHVQVRLAAMKALASIVESGGQHAIPALLECLGERDLVIREAAMEPLLQICEHGSQHTMPTMCTCLFRSGQGDGKASVKILAKIMESKNQHVIAMLPECLRSKEFHDQAMNAIDISLADEDIDTMAAALELFAEMIVHDDESAVPRLAQHLLHRHHVVRESALRGLARLAKKGADAPIAAFCAWLEDGAVEVKSFFLEVLTQITEKGDASAMSAMSACLEDQTRCVKESALEALANITERGNDHATLAFSVCLADDDLRVRQSAKQALLKTTEHGCTEKTVLALTDRLDHKDPQVVELALEILKNIADTRNRRIAPAIKRCMMHDSFAIRSASMEILSQITGNTLKLKTQEDVEYTIEDVDWNWSVAELKAAAADHVGISQREQVLSIGADDLQDSWKLVDLDINDVFTLHRQPLHACRFQKDCKFGDKCKFSHDIPKEKRGNKVTRECRRLGVSKKEYMRMRAEMAVPVPKAATTQPPPPPPYGMVARPYGQYPSYQSSMASTGTAYFPANSRNAPQDYSRNGPQDYSRNAPQDYSRNAPQDYSRNAPQDYRWYVQPDQFYPNG